MTPLEDEVRKAFRAKADQVRSMWCRPCVCPPAAGASFLWPTVADRGWERRPGAAGSRQQLRRSWS